MKRIACFLLVALMLAVGGASAGEKNYAAMLEQQKAEGLLHLWDIPFGIGVDVFEKLAEEKTGFEFEIKKYGENFIGCTMSNYENTEEAPRVSGYIVKGVTAEFNSKIKKNDEGVDELTSILISWLLNETMENEYIVNMLCDLQAKLNARYGPYEEAVFSVFDFKDGEQFRSDCILINDDGSVNAADIVSAMDNRELLFEVNFFWKNAKLSFVSSAHSEIFPPTNIVLFSVHDEAVEREPVKQLIRYADRTVMQKENNVDF